MDIHNAFTFHVPDGMLDDTLLTFCLPEVIEKIKQENPFEDGKRNAITLLKSTCMRIVLMVLTPNDEIDFHESGNLISIQIMDGKINFLTDSQSIILGKGSLLTCHEDTPHTLVAIEASVVLLTIAIGALQSRIN